MFKVSVIIPVYNAAEYLCPCLDSVMNQTLKDIEVLLVDDGSKDDSRDICDRYAKMDSRFKVLSQENGGACVARNHGIACAQGEYLLFLDSDDFFELDMCERAYAAAENTAADVVLFGADIFDQATGTYNEAKWLLDASLVPEKPFFGRGDVPDSLFQIVAGGPCNKLYRRSFIVDNGIDFPLLPSLEDVPFVYTALALADRIAVVDCVLQHYRRNAPKSGLVGKASEYPTRIFDSFGILKERLERAEVYDLLERTFLNRAASDFVDQYLYVLKDDETRKFYRMYFARVAAPLFGLDDKPEEFYHRKVVYNRIAQMIDGRGEVGSGDGVALSIIVPVYNVEPYIRQCINSLFEQTRRDFEMIFVDDGSTDNSLSILNEYARMDGRITVLSQENQFAGVARNTGMKRAQGEYLLFLDPDDFFAPNLVEDLLAAACAVDADVTLCDGYYYNNVTGVTTPAPLLLQRYNIPKKRVFSYKDNPDKILHISIDCPWNKLFKKSFIDRCGLQFQPLRSANDVYFVDCALMLADRITVVDRKLINYRTNVHTSLQANRAKEPLNFYQALTAVRDRMKGEERYREVERSLRSLFIAGCRSHLNRARDAAEYSTLYDFYVQTAFAEWEVDTDDAEQFVYVSDRKWVEEIQHTSPADYLLGRIRSLESDGRKLAEENRALKASSSGTRAPVGIQVASSNGGEGRIKYYRSYAIGCAITWLPRKLRGGIRCLREHGLSYTVRRAVEHMGIPAGAELPRPTRGVTRRKRDIPIIVSLTTYPGRINCVHKAVESLLAQTMKPDEVILWLARDQFPGGMHALPEELLALRKRGLRIAWCDNFMSHKKYYMVMRDYPNALIITADDDLYYAADMVEELYEAHRRFPTCVCATRCHLVLFDANGNPLPYKQWQREQSRFVNVPSSQLVSTSGAGVLYPPNCMSEELFDSKTFLSICRNADDMWLKTMQTLSGTKTVQIAPNRPLRYVEGSQAEALWHSNLANDGNDIQIKALMEKYPGSWSAERLEDVAPGERATI